MSTKAEQVQRRTMRRNPWVAGRRDNAHDDTRTSYAVDTSKFYMRELRNGLQDRRFLATGDRRENVSEFRDYEWMRRYGQRRVVEEWTYHGPEHRRKIVERRQGKSVQIENDQSS